MAWQRWPPASLNTTTHYLATKGEEAVAINAAHSSHRYIQYRATLSSNYGDTPVLDRVEISFK